MATQDNKYFSMKTTLHLGVGSNKCKNCPIGVVKCITFGDYVDDKLCVTSVFNDKICRNCTDRINEQYIKIFVDRLRLESIEAYEVKTKSTYNIEFYNKVIKAHDNAEKVCKCNHHK